MLCCEDVCAGSFSVYRFSFTLSLFFGILALFTVGTTRAGAKAHRGFWFAKALLLLALLVSSLWITNGWLQGFREFARYSSFLFLLLQVRSKKTRRCAGAGGSGRLLVFPAVKVGEPPREEQGASGAAAPKGSPLANAASRPSSVNTTPDTSSLPPCLSCRFILPPPAPDPAPDAPPLAPPHPAADPAPYCPRRPA